MYIIFPNNYKSNQMPQLHIPNNILLLFIKYIYNPNNISIRNYHMTHPNQYAINYESNVPYTMTMKFSFTMALSLK